MPSRSDDTLAAGGRVATPNRLGRGCDGGTITAAAGGSVIRLAGATLAAGASDADPRASR